MSYNDGSSYTFVWDSDIKRLRAIDDDISTLPEWTRIGHFRKDYENELLKIEVAVSVVSQQIRAIFILIIFTKNAKN